MIALRSLGPRLCLPRSGAAHHALLGLAFLFLLAPGALATTVRIPDDFDSLGAALTAIASGDTILVAPGEYSGRDNRRVLVREKEFVLLSEEGADRTILDLGRENGFCLQLELQTRATIIDGFTFQHARWEGAVVVRSSGPIIRNCVFRRNHAEAGAGISVLGTSPVLIEDCLFEDNEAVLGGGVSCDRLALAEFDSCRFFRNEATDGGAIGGFDQMDIQIRNCLFVGNSAGRGGAVSLFPNGPTMRAAIAGCTFAENTASESGGGLWFDGRTETDLTIEQTIFFANTSPSGPAVHADGFSRPPRILCSAILPIEVIGDVEFVGQNVSEDPRFCNGSGPLEHRYRLREDSPCLPAESPCGALIGAYAAGCPAEGGGACCLAGGACVLTTVDACDGVYQGDGAPCDLEPCRPGGVCCADGVCAIATREHCDAVGGVFLGSEGECPPEGCPVIACCLPDGSCEVLEPDDCLAEGGTCIHDTQSCDPSPCGPRARRVPSAYPTIAAALTAACPGDTVLLAPGTYTGAGNRDVHLEGAGLLLASEEGPESTIIDCSGLGRAFFVWGAHTSVRIEGLTVRGGRPNYPDHSEVEAGGGVYVRYGALVLANCVIEGNWASNHGGGIAAYDSRLRVEDCRITGNLASQGLPAYGGGIYAWNSDVVVARSKVAGNRGQRGGGIYAKDGSLAVEGCEVTGNRSDSGGGIRVDGSTAELGSTTIAGNWARQDGGGIRTLESTALSIRNSIVWGNLAPRGSEARIENPADPEVFSCTVVYTPGIEGGGLDLVTGAIFQDPLFCAAIPANEAPTTGGDYTVASNSICVDDGDSCIDAIGALPAACAPIGIGACCSGETAACLLASVAECARTGWIFVGEGVPCDPSPCEVPGACCFNDGRCQLLIEAFCLERSGRHHGTGSLCDPNPCPAPRGCCREGQECVLLPPEVCEESAGLVLEVGEPCHPWTCEPNANGRLVVHAGTPGDEPPALAMCADATNSASDSGVVLATVIAAFPPENVPRLRRAAFAISYPSDAIEVLSWSVVSGTAIPDASWPAPGSGIVIEWDEVRRGSFEPLCSFELAVTDGPVEFSTIASPSEDGGFWDDFTPQNVEGVGCFGSLGLGRTGQDCCWSLGACCVEDFADCIETTGAYCAVEDGFYQEDGSRCPCGYPAVLLGGVELEERDFAVELSWTASSDVGFRAFEVLRSDGGEDGAQALGGSAEELEGVWRYRDGTVAPSRRYSYWIEATESDGATERFGPWDIEIAAATKPRLLAVRPNPTVGSAEVEFFLPSPLPCSLAIFDAAGRVVAEADFGKLAGGYGVRAWDGRDRTGRPVPAGIYFLRFRAGAWSFGGKLVRIG